MGGGNVDGRRIKIRAPAVTSGGTELKGAPEQPPHLQPQSPPHSAATGLCTPPAPTLVCGALRSYHRVFTSPHYSSLRGILKWKLCHSCTRTARSVSQIEPWKEIQGPYSNPATLWLGHCSAQLASPSAPVGLADRVRREDRATPAETHPDGVSPRESRMTGPAWL